MRITGKKKITEHHPGVRGHIFFDASSLASSSSSPTPSSSASFVPPGSNVAWKSNGNDTQQVGNDTVRVRNEWNALSNYDRALYLDASKNI